MTAEYSVEIRKYDKGKETDEQDWMVPIASMTVRGEAAIARVLHGYAESIEDELPPRQYDTDPPTIVRPDWFGASLESARKLALIEERARDIVRTHSSPNAKLAALYILNGDESTKQELYDIEPDISYAPFDPEPQSH